MTGVQTCALPICEATAIMMSCKRSIKANHYLNEAQARVLDRKSVV
nr:hypothetical protein [Enterococcus faecium]